MVRPRRPPQGGRRRPRDLEEGAVGVLDALQGVARVAALTLHQGLAQAAGLGLGLAAALLSDVVCRPAWGGWRGRDRHVLTEDRTAAAGTAPRGSCVGMAKGVPPVTSHNQGRLAWITLLAGWVSRVPWGQALTPVPVAME